MEDFNKSNKTNTSTNKVTLLKDNIKSEISKNLNYLLDFYKDKALVTNPDSKNHLIRKFMYPHKDKVKWDWIDKETLKERVDLGNELIAVHYKILTVGTLLYASIINYWYDSLSSFNLFICNFVFITYQSMFNVLPILVQNRIKNSFWKRIKIVKNK